MIDTLLSAAAAARANGRPRRAWASRRSGYGFVTLHRPSNVDDPAVLGRLVGLLHELSRELPLVFPVHPRTPERREAGSRRAWRPDRSGCSASGRSPTSTPSRSSSDAAVVLTDSGGLQEESSVLGVPCLTLRENTERPVTVELGTSRLVGNDLERIRAAWRDVRSGAWSTGGAIPFWDGHAGERVAQAIADRLA